MELDSVALRRLAIATLALLSSSLGGLQLAVVLVRPEWFEYLCSIFDASPGFTAFTTLLWASPIVTFLIVDYRIIGREQWQWGWQRWAARTALLVGVVNVVADVLILRGPWLLGNAGRFDRVSIWTARLSSTYGGVPWTAFCLNLGYGVMLWCVTSAFIRAYGMVQRGAQGHNSLRMRALSWLWCTLLFVTGFAALCAFATGGAI